jgi:hypothetical protein
MALQQEMGSARNQRANNITRKEGKQWQNTM